MIRTLFPGIALAILIAAAGIFVSKLVPALGDMTLVILLGILVGNSVKLPQSFSPGLEFCEKRLLSLSVMLIGFSLNMATIEQLGLPTLGGLFAMIWVTIGLSWYTAKIFGLPPSLGALLGVGNAICGASAIAAASPLLSKSKQEVGIAIGVVNLLGTLGMFLLPILLHLLNFETPQAGLIIGGSLQAVGNVIAAGFSISREVGDTATAVKLVRIFLLGPTLLGLAALAKCNFRKHELAQANISKRAPFAMPTYLYGFAVAAIIFNLGLLPANIVSGLQKTSHSALLIAMAGNGLRIHLSTLLRQGPQAFCFGAALFSVQLLIILAAVSLTLP